MGRRHRRHLLLLVPLGFTSHEDTCLGTRRAVCMEGGYPCLVCPQDQGLARPYLGPAADEQVQHILTDLVIVLIQKLVDLAKSKTLQGQGEAGQDVPQ